MLKMIAAAAVCLFGCVLAASGADDVPFRPGCGAKLVSASRCTNYRSIKLSTSVGQSLGECERACYEQDSCAGFMQGANNNCYFVKTGCANEAHPRFKYFQFVRCANGEFSPWKEFSACSKSCGPGTQSRTRTCTQEPCIGSLKESRACNMKTCPVDGTWNGWGGYSACTVTCGQGRQTRYRTCNPPKHGGLACPGSSSQATTCYKPRCTGGCPASHPYAYYYGQYCCQFNREKHYGPQGWQCDGSQIGYNSLCCQNDAHVRCPRGRCQYVG